MILLLVATIVALVSLPGWLMNNEIKNINKIIKDQLNKSE